MNEGRLTISSGIARRSSESSTMYPPYMSLSASPSARIIAFTRVEPPEVEPPIASSSSLAERSSE